MKVLIAEDDKFLLSAYKAKLTKAGFELRLASDGEEVINALKTFTPDVILLDLILPKIDGFAVLKEIKGDPRLKNIPIVVASNLGQSEDLDKAKSLGADDYIIKSDLSLDYLVKKLQAIVQ